MEFMCHTWNKFEKVSHIDINVKTGETFFHSNQTKFSTEIQLKKKKNKQTNQQTNRPTDKQTELIQAVFA